ncbi:MAG TPA: YIP1 family protein [Pyrinomonadaceae bacterium]|jgi:hypothetical protein
MNRIIALGVLLGGVALLFGSFSMITPGMAFAGFCMILAGVIALSMSFIPRHEPEPESPVALTPAQSVTGIFTSPASVFRNLSAHPRWVAAFFVALLCLGIYGLLFVRRVTPEAIETLRIEKIINNGWIPADKQADFRAGQMASAQTPLYSLSPLIVTGVFSFISVIGIAVICLLGVAMFGGRITFWEALAVSAYTFLPVAVFRGLVGLLILYIKAPESLDPLHDQAGIVNENLGVLFSPMQQPVLYTIATFFSLFWLYRVWLLATGLHNIGRKPISTGAAWAISIAVWITGLSLWVLIAATSSSFVA